MKKSLLILSMMAVAATAVAYDSPTAGKSYVIKTNRGTLNYLAYGRNDNATALSYLSRTGSLSDVNIWTVGTGTASGTYTIKNYTVDAYLMNFVDSENETTYALNAEATTTSSPVDLVLKNMEGAYAISLNVSETYVTLDAPGGTAGYCGNWIPTNPSSGEGACFWFYEVDLSNGTTAGLAGVEAAIQADAEAAALEAAKAAFKSTVELYVEYFEAFKANVPQVAAELEAGIAELNALEYSETADDEITTIWYNTTDAANTTLKTALADKSFVMKNLRRAASYPATGGYLAVTVGEEGAEFGPSTSYTGDDTAFKFTLAADGGYYAYNEATKTYLGLDHAIDGARFSDATNYLVPVEDQASAVKVTPVLNFNSGYIGASLEIGELTDDESSDPISLNMNYATDLWYYYSDDAGSIWGLITYDPAELVAMLAQQYQEKYENYIAAVPEVKEIFEAAVAEIKALTFSTEMGDEAVAIDTKAMADANELLTTCYADKVVTLYNYRTDAYLSISDDAFVANSQAYAENVAFTMVAVDGGYVLYNNATEKYIYRVDNSYPVDWSGNSMSVTSNESEAAVVTPILGTTDGTPVKYGVNLAVAESESGTILALHSSGNNLLYYYGDVNGSIWTIAEYSDEPAEEPGDDAIDEVKAESKVIEGIFDLQGRKLAAPVKGINIINGKKVLVK